MQVRNPNNPKGIDVSWYQGDINWHRVRAADYRFAFLKATEGYTMADTMFNPNLFGARQAGLAVGAYHYMHATTKKEAEREADFFIQTVIDAGGFNLFDLPPRAGCGGSQAATKRPRGRLPGVA